MPDRDRYRSLAQANLQIFDDGLYQASDGTVVLIADQVAQAIAGTQEVSGASPTSSSAMASASMPAPASNTGKRAVHGMVPSATRIRIADQTTLDGAAQLVAKGLTEVAVLNFASARSPGGGFLRGSQAQEESLCYATTLYAALSRQMEFYARNRAWPDALYPDALLYTPDVCVIRDGFGHLLAQPWPIAVITAPAPNRAAISDPALLARVGPTLCRRIDLILGTAARFGHRHLVLGAWGCGVFGNAPDQVAQAFRGALSGAYAGVFQNVLFAIPKGRTHQTHQVFRDILSVS